MDDQTIIVIKAPQGTRLEVPDPDESSGSKRLYQIFLKSTSQRIDAYLVQHDDEVREEPEATYQDDYYMLDTGTEGISAFYPS